MCCVVALRCSVRILQNPVSCPPPSLFVCSVFSYVCRPASAEARGGCVQHAPSPSPCPPPSLLLSGPMASSLLLCSLPRLPWHPCERTHIDALCFWGPLHTWLCAGRKVYLLAPLRKPIIPALKYQLPGSHHKDHPLRKQNKPYL